MRANRRKREGKVERKAVHHTVKQCQYTSFSFIIYNISLICDRDQPIHSTPLLILQLKEEEKRKMSVRGVKQMKELVIRYSDYDGSSRGIRDWMNKNLLNFAKGNPDLQIRTEIKRAKHPVVRGEYMNGNSKTVCVKNLAPENIEQQIFHLRNQAGKKVSNY